MKKQYYLVVGPGINNAHFTSVPVSSSEEACENCFGFTHETFKCYPVGEEKPTGKTKEFIIENKKSLLKK